MSNVACCVYSVYKKMFDMPDIGLMLGAGGGGAKWVCQNLMPPIPPAKKEKNKRVAKQEHGKKSSQHGKTWKHGKVCWHQIAKIQQQTESPSDLLERDIWQMGSKRLGRKDSNQSLQPHALQFAPCLIGQPALEGKYFACEVVVHGDGGSCPAEKQASARDIL